MNEIDKYVGRIIKTVIFVVILWSFVVASGVI